MSVKTIIFDLDGTLIDSAPPILDCFTSILQHNNLQPRLTINQDLIGPPLLATLELISGITDPHKLASLSKDFRNCYDNGNALKTQFYKGVTHTLNYLYHAGISLHIATNKRLQPSLQILEKLEYIHIFDSIYALDMPPPPLKDKTELLKKQITEQHIDIDTAIYIGDKQDDGIAADNNKLRFIYASWGYGKLSKSALPKHWQWTDYINDIHNFT